MMSYDEFCEIASINDPFANPASPEKKEDSPTKTQRSEAKSFVSPEKGSKEPEEPGTEPVKKFNLEEEKSAIKASPEKRE